MTDNITRVVDIRVDTTLAVKGIAEYQLKLEEVKKAENELRKAIDEKGEKTEADRQKLAVYTEQQKAYKKEIALLSKEVQNNIISGQKYQNTLKGLGAELSNAKDKLRAMEIGTKAYADQEAKVTALNQRLKEAEQAYGVYTRDVGNYEKATKGLRTEMREMTEQLVAMKLAGQENSAEYKNLSARAAELNDAMGDVNAQTKGLASDTAGLDAATQSMQALIGAYGIWTSVAGAATEADSQLAETMKNMQIVMTALVSLTAIMNSLQKDKIIYQTAVKVQTWAQVKAETARAAALTASGVAQWALVAAQKAFNAAAAANPLTLVLAAFVACIGAVYGLVKAFGIFSKSSKQQQEDFKKQGDEIDKLNKKYDEHIAKTKALGASDDELAFKQLAATKHVANLRAAHFAEAERLYRKNKDEYKQALDAKKEAETDYQKALIETRNRLMSIGSGYDDAVLKKKMGEVAYATKQANDRFAEQTQVLQTLKREGTITVIEYNTLLQQLDGAREAAIQQANAEAAQREKERRGQRAATEMSELRAAVDAEVALMKDGATKQLAAENVTYARRVADLKKRLETETNLTEKAKAAINKQIEIAEQQHKLNVAAINEAALSENIKKEEEIIALKLAAIKKGSAEEYALKFEQLGKQKELELNNAELTAQQRLLIEQKYAAQEKALRDEQANAQIKKTQEALRLEWENKINAATVNHQNTLQLELQYRKAELDALQQMEGESDAQFKARQLEAQKNYVDAKKAINDYEVEIEQTKLQAMSDIAGGLAGLFEEIGESNEEFAQMSKVITLAQIAIDTGKAIAAGTASAMSMPFPSNFAAVATTVATVLANITTAIKTVKSAKFATGGYVSGSGSGTSDSISARLSNGESVNNAVSTSLFTPIYSALNQLGGGIPIVATQSSNQIAGEDMLARAVAKGVSALRVRVGIDEVSRVQSRVDIVEQLGDL